MTKVNKPGSQKPGGNNPDKPDVEIRFSTPAATNKGKPGKKNRRSAVGGTAVPGARSTLPKEVKASTPAEQQAEYSNREMRRRMQHMGIGPSENPAMTAREKRLKRLERKKQRQREEVQKTIAKSPKPSTSLGRRNTYFLIGVVALLIVLVVLFIIIRHPF